MYTEYSRKSANTHNTGCFVTSKISSQYRALCNLKDQLIISGAGALCNLKDKRNISAKRMKACSSCIFTVHFSCLFQRSKAAHHLQTALSVFSASPAGSVGLFSEFGGSPSFFSFSDFSDFCGRVRLVLTALCRHAQPQVQILSPHHEEPVPEERLQ